MAPSFPWFPDVLAGWYDHYVAHRVAADIEQWRYVRPRLVEQWTSELAQAPHTAAARIEQAIAKRPTAAARQERTFRALQAASTAFERVGVTTGYAYGGVEWAEIRHQWSQHGNLVKHAAGVLLPRRPRRHGWQTARPEPKIYHPGAMFSGFLRPAAPRDLDIAFRTMPDLELTEQAIAPQLRIAVAPLVNAMDELKFEPIDDPAGRRAFRVGLTDADAITERAKQTVAVAGRLRCDVLLFPELCLSPAGQAALQAAMPSLVTRAGGRPWLVVAGSSLTPAAGGGCHNRAVVLDGEGRERLAHNKLHPYEMSSREADRYGIGEALHDEPRVEDIVVQPRRLELLECPLGRTAVLICEDLSNFDTFGPVVQDFEVDWLLVPVMDGVQTTTRWTASYSSAIRGGFRHGGARRYVRRAGRAAPRPSSRFVER